MTTTSVPNLTAAARAAHLDALVDQLIPREQCVLSYDASLLAQLPDILAELHGVRSSQDAGRLVGLQELIDALGLAPGWRLGEIPEALRAAGVDEARFAPRPPEDRLKKQADQFEHWSERRADEDLGSVLQLQRDLAMGTYNQAMQRYAPDWQGQAPLRHYLRGVTTAPPGLAERILRLSFWELRIRLWLLMGRLRHDLPSLSVGPRWVTEVRFFREVLGLRAHIGLDLFSDDEQLVVAGDMHAMPFPDAHFQLVFLKNVVDKSYDVRKLVQELVRVVRPGGIVIVDQICGYGACSPLTRTDIQSARNLRRVFEARVPLRSLVCTDVDISKLGDAAGTGERRYNARLAVQLRAS